MKRKKKKMSKKQFAETMAQELNRYFEENLTMEVHAAIREFVKTTITPTTPSCWNGRACMPFRR